MKVLILFFFAWYENRTIFDEACNSFVIVLSLGPFYEDYDVLMKIIKLFVNRPMDSMYFHLCLIVDLLLILSQVIR